MPKTRANLTVTQRSAIVALHTEGVSLSCLASKYNVARSTILRICSKERTTGSTRDLQRSGRPRSTTERQNRLIHRLQVQSPTTSSSLLTSQFTEQTQIRLHPSTVRRRLVEMGLVSYIAPKKHMISKVNKAKRLA